MKIDEKCACCLLTYMDMAGPGMIGRMKMLAGSYSACLDMPPEEFMAIDGFGPRRARELGQLQQSAQKLIREYEGFAERGINIIFIEEEDYPARLRAIKDAPPVLFARGRLPDDDRPSASIIGARNCSDYGTAAAEYFAGELASKGVQIVSGMAHGIDGAAARGALRAGYDSFAVLGSGVDICYPKENYGLYELMSGTGEQGHARGGVISEFHPLGEAIAGHFIMRNRIIAGLGDVLLVIEAREHSGTSITVNYALEQGKEIFALPGRITDPLGRGCNRLLRDGALPLTEPADVLSYLGVDEEPKVVTAARDISALTEEERRIYSKMDYDAMHIENIAAAAGMGLRDAMKAVSALERGGYIENTGRVYYKKIL